MHLLSTCPPCPEHFALLVHHYVPESRSLRQWLTHEVLPELHRRAERMLEEPSINRLEWLAQVPKRMGIWQRLMAWFGHKDKSMKF